MSVDPYLPRHGDESYKVTHYDLDLDYSAGTNQLTGRAILSITALDGLDRLRIDLRRLRVDKVSVAGQKTPTYRHHDGHLYVKFAKKIAKGEQIEVTVRYRGKPGLVNDRAGEAGWEELEDGAMAANQPGGAPGWFPCNDRADNKSTFTFTVRASSDYFVVANGNRVARRRQASTTTWIYEQTKPISTYLACVSIGRYDEVAQDSQIPLAGVVPSARKDAFLDAFSDQPAMLAFFTKIFGPYPFSNYRVVVTADKLDIPLEAGAIATFGDNYLNREWSTQRLIAHELSHQWFGNSVTARRWRDIWLHEGFACYSEWLWSEESGGQTADQWAEHFHTKLSNLPQNLVLGDPGPDDMFDDRVYKRGALTLHALRLRIGDPTFFALLLDWTSTNAYGLVKTSDFETLAATSAGADLGDFFNAWLREPKLPALR